MSRPLLDPTAIRRLDPVESQRVFRAVLDALANPGRIGRLAVPTGIAPVLLPALALVDLEVVVAVVGSTIGDRAERPDAAAPLALVRATGCRITDDVAAADLIVALREPTGDELRRLRRGDATSPEHGARLVLACERLDEPAPAARHDATQVWVAGPGARSGRLLGVAGLGDATFEALAEVNRAYPAGVDTWLVDDDGRIAGVPRSCTIDLVAGGL